MSLQEIKDQIAKETGNWKWEFLTEYGRDKYWSEVCRRACKETGRLTLEKALANVESHGGSILNSVAILDPSNIVIPD